MCICLGMENNMENQESQVGVNGLTPSDTLSKANNDFLFDGR